jgi:protein MAK11
VSTANSLSLSTEDGRIVFFDTSTTTLKGDTSSSIPAFLVTGQIGGSLVGVSSRIKEYSILPLLSTNQEEGTSSGLLIVAGGSDGIVRIWSLMENELLDTKAVSDCRVAIQVGNLLGSYETGNRITCLTGFIMATTFMEQCEVEKGDDEHTGSNDSDSGVSHN